MGLFDSIKNIMTIPDEDEFEETSIPEEEVRTVTQKDYEPTDALESADVNNVSVDDLFAMLDGTKEATKHSLETEKKDQQPKTKE